MSPSKPTLGSPELLVHECGPEQDRAARLTVCQLMAQTGHSPKDIYEVLDCLALLPGNEDRSESSKPLVTAPWESACTPTTSRTGYVPK